MSVQQQMWNMVAGTSKSIYVSNPKNGGGLHNYGLAVDITLCWRNELRNALGKLLHAAGDTTGLSMGTPIDYLGKLAHVRDETAHFNRGWLKKRAHHSQTMVTRSHGSRRFQGVAHRVVAFQLQNSRASESTLQSGAIKNRTSPSFISLKLLRDMNPDFSALLLKTSDFIASASA